jgi:hypothetical protein
MTIIASSIKLCQAFFKMACGSLEPYFQKREPAGSDKTGTTGDFALTIARAGHIITLNPSSELRIKAKS